MAVINGNEIFFGIVETIKSGDSNFGETVILQAGEIGEAGEVTELEEE